MRLRPASPGWAASARASGPVAFMSAVGGRFNGGIKTLGMVAPGQTAWVQVRVWESAYGRSYEEARSNDLATQAELIGRATAVALQFDDPRFAASNSASMMFRSDR